MKVWSHSKMDDTGRECIVIEVEPAEVVPVDCSSPEFWASGGMYINFVISRKQKQTEANWMFLYRGSPQTGGKVHTWRDEIWTEEMCLRFCEENYGGGKKDGSGCIDPK